MSGNYKILYHPDCLKDIKKMDAPTLQRIQNAIENRLAVAPADFGKPLRHSAKGLWSLRAGDWRVIYQIREETILILRIGHRREVYKLF